MRELPKDITDEMKIRFDSDLISANKILAKYLTENDYLNSDRIIRCVVYLTQNGIESFEKNLILAKTDPRDVILWAEYERGNGAEPKRVRDFNKTFQ
ncbi:hypothetical protein VOI54_12475 [Tamlana sp. 2201CG12-4]|uniref:hypothetical protein n=1 Tax=Tamlana sp. 2201CG12-4 TaxID=3112582 RepID=UPI002DBFFB7F|nr:hypothetical protein [Tamlana sp. 2201CG12-4]MEC3907836.1 hypothetical protein [Tamlana sp. 2201CG12-4]